MPARSLEHISLQELMQAIRQPVAELPSSLQRHRAVGALMAELEAARGQTLAGQSVADWVRETANGES